MKIRDLKVLLAVYPDDADVAFELDANGATLLPIFRDVFSVAAGNEPKPEIAEKVTLLETVDESEDSPHFEEQIRLGVPDEFLDLCIRYGVDSRKVLHGFIADLCGITNYHSDPRADRLSSHGSDERDLAWSYFERCGYPYLHDDIEAGFGDVKP